MDRIRELEFLSTKLRNGEYNGVDIMAAWIAIEELIEIKKQLLEPPTPPTRLG